METKGNLSLVLGRESGRLALASDHVAWAGEFARERERILGVLADQMVAIEHVGSTALPGVPAKPILDILIEVTDFEAARVCIEPMESLGYMYRGEYGISRRHYFVKGEPRTHHVHMLEVGRDETWGMRTFRDALRARSSLAQEYADEKLSLAAMHADNRTAYQEAKDRVVERMLQKLSAQWVQKVIAYVIRGTQLLVFTQPDFPEAGIQTPGGTVEQGESLDAAVLREAYEETGLEGLSITSFLGSSVYDHPDGRLLERNYFQLACPGELPETWDHWETSPSGGGPAILFRYRWIELSQVPELSAGCGTLLARLRDS